MQRAEVKDPFGHPENHLLPDALKSGPEDLAHAQRDVSHSLPKRGRGFGSSAHTFALHFVDEAIEQPHGLFDQVEGKPGLAQPADHQRIERRLPMHHDILAPRAQDESLAVGEDVSQAAVLEAETSAARAVFFILCHVSEDSRLGSS